MAHCYQHNIIDCSKKYKMKMYVKGTYEREEREAEFSCSYVDKNSGFIRAICDGFDSKLFYEDYFKWLLYTGDIEEVTC